MVYGYVLASSHKCVSAFNVMSPKKDDLPILAERFTTSKLSTFSDLKRLTTYGFRGEALASISYVSNLTVVTKTKNDSCAWKYAGFSHRKSYAKAPILPQSLLRRWQFDPGQDWDYSGPQTMRRE